MVGGQSCSRKGALHMEYIVVAIVFIVVITGYITAIKKD